MEAELLMAYDLLNGWKEIANYVGRGVRTVQRWEHDLGFPAHRPRRKPRSAVIAFKHEMISGYRVDAAKRLNKEP
jgi:hypothetical protein